MSTPPVSNKRKRTDTAGRSVMSTSTISASQPVPGPPKGQVSVNSSSFEAPPAWAFFLQNIPATNTPPPGVLVAFAKMYHSAITGYRSALTQHHKITAAWNRFTAESEGDSIPLAIADTLKGPTFLFPKDLSAVGEELTAGARETYTNALKVMRKTAVDYISACHQRNVEASQSRIDVKSKGMCLSLDLQSYAYQVIKDAGHTDSYIWKAYIKAVVSALEAELSSIRFDVAALVLAERQEEAAKQAGLTTAIADAEMMDSTQSIDSIIEEHVNAVSKRINKQMEETDVEPKKKKRKKNKPNPEPSSSNTPNAPASSSKAATSSSKDAASKKKEMEPVAKRDGKKKAVSAQEKKGKAPSKKLKPSESNDSD